MTERRDVRDGLPPEDARVWNVSKQGLLQTPPDALGRVDLDALVHLGKETIVQDYDWTSQFNDIHHLQWPGRLYQADTLSDFRELKGRKVWLPRVFHNWLHFVTDVPTPPSKEVMQESVIAERVAIELTRTAHRATLLSQLTEVHNRDLLIEHLFEQYSHFVELAAIVPQEFQLLSVDQVEAQNVEQMLERHSLLGQLALDTIPSRVRAVNHHY